MIEKTPAELSVLRALNGCLVHRFNAESNTLIQGL